MADEPKLIVALEARLDKFEKQLRQAGFIAEREAKEIEQKLSISDIAFGTAAAQLLVKAMTAAVDDLQKKIQEAVEQMRSLGDTARKTGLDMETIQRIGFAARAAGLSDQEIFAGLNAAAAKMEEMNRRTTELSKLLDAENLKYREQNGLVVDVNKGLDLAGILMGRAGNELERIEIAKMFGLTEKWVAALGKGVDNFREMKEAAKLDPNLERAIQHMVEIDKLANQVKAEMAGWGSNLITNVLPALQAVLQFLVPMVEAFSRLGKGGMFEGFTESVEAATKRLLELTEKANTAANKVRIEVRKTSEIKWPKKDVDETTSAFDRQADSISKHIAVMEADAKAMFLGVGAQEQLRTEAKLLEAAQRDGIAVTDEQRAKIDQLSSRASAAALALASARAQFQLFHQIGERIAGGVADAFVDAVSGAKSFQEAFREMTQAVLKDIARLLIKQALLSSFSAFGIPGFAPGRMAGGPVTAGQPYRVGERGPELFVPKQSGVIVPNAAMRQMGGQTVVNMPINSTVNAPTGMNKTELAAVLAIERRRMRAEVVPIVKTAASRGAL